MSLRPPLSALVAVVLCALVVFSALVLVGRTADQLALGTLAFDRIEVQVSEFMPSQQGHVALDMDREGNVVAVWDSRRQQNGTSGIYARWIDRNGLLLGAEEQVNVETRSQQERPAVTLGADGAPWFTWVSLGQDGDLGSIVARCATTEGMVNAVTAGEQRSVATTRLADGRFVAVWETPGDERQASAIAVRLFDAQGAPCGEERRIDSPAGRIDRLPAVAAAGEGFVVAWGRSTIAGEIEGIFAARFASDGALAGEVFRVSKPGRDALEPSAAGNGAGRFTIAWMRLDPGSDYEIVMRRYAEDGAPVDGEEIVSAGSLDWQSGVAVAMAADGRTALAWNRLWDGGRAADVHARLFDVDGGALGSSFRVNAYAEGRQMLAAACGAKRLAMGSDGRLAVAWEGDSGRGDESAAHVTLLIPREPGAAGDLAAAARICRGRLASWRKPARPGGIHVAGAAAPHVPPTYDAKLRQETPAEVTVVRRGRGIGFDGVYSTGWAPPDPHMAVGADHVLLIVNGGIVARQKDGTLEWQQPIEGASGFWGSLGADYFVFDPEVLYDVLEDRYLAMANERTDSHSFFLLAVSSTDDPNDPWYKYRFDVTSLAGDDIDSPNLAVDANAIYLTADFFGPDKYLLFIVDKSSVIDGGTAITTHYLHTGSQSFGLPSMYTTDAPRMYMIEAYEGIVQDKVRLWAIDDPLGTPSLQSTELTVPSYRQPANTRSKGTTTVVETFEARFWSAMYRDGSLWACHHISTQLSPNRNCVARWYEIAMNGWPVSGEPALVQSGTIGPGEDLYLSFNSIFADENGNAVMVYSRSGVDEYYSIRRVFRRALDPLGSMQGPDVVKQSTSAYLTDRWGDYSAVVADPFAANVFWMHHEYTVSGSWRTWVESEEVSDPLVGAPLAAAAAEGRLLIAPSPTSGPARLSFALPAAGRASVELFDVAGRSVRRLDLGERGAGVSEITWDGRNESGAAVARGVYLARVICGGRVIATGKLAVTR
jgi:hypothetical protein